MRKKDFNELPQAIWVLGENFKLTPAHIEQLKQLEQKIGIIRGANAKCVAYFIKHDLNAWDFRITEIKKLKNTITEHRYILLMGEKHGSAYWTEISTKKKDSQTEEAYIEKYGESQGRLKWSEINCRRGMSSFNTQHWMGQGYTESEAKAKVSEISKRGSLKGNGIQQKHRDEDYESWAKKMPTTVDYWVHQGHTEAEAKVMVSKRQTTFSKEKCIEKYGQEIGLKKWEQRQEKWAKSLASNTSNRKIGMASKESLGIFKPAIRLLESLNIGYSIGLPGNAEFQLFGNGRLNLYDFVIEELKLCFEYNGEKFHPNPQWKINNITLWEQWRHLGSGMTSEEKFEFDRKKIDLMKNLGFEVHEIWSSVSVGHNQKFIVAKINEKILKK